MNYLVTSQTTLNKQFIPKFLQNTVFIDYFLGVLSHVTEPLFSQVLAFSYKDEPRRCHQHDHILSVFACKVQCDVLVIETCVWGQT